METPDPWGSGVAVAQKKKAIPFGMVFWGKAPGDDLLLHGLSHTTIGAVAFHCRVRDGIGWFHNAMVTRETVGGFAAQSSPGASHAHALAFGVAYKLGCSEVSTTSRRVVSQVCIEFFSVFV